MTFGSRTLRALIAALLALATLATACGGDDDVAASRTTAAPKAAANPFPVTFEVGGKPLTIAAKPTAIVSLSPTATEMLFAIGAGPQVKAVDDQSTYPADAPRTDLSGFTPNIEAIAGYKPDLVVIADDSGDLEASLTKLGIPVLVHPAATKLDDSYAQIDQLGRATGNAKAAETLAMDMKAQIADIIAGMPDRDDPLRIYHELDPTFYSATSATFIGQLYEMAGFENIADAADADGESGGYPQLTNEFIVAANPDVILLADTKCCEQSAATVAARPGWAALSALTTKGVVELDDDVASRWGPRVVDLLRTIALQTSLL